MTRNYFIQLADYNIWANNIVHGWLDKISDDQWAQPIVSSFNSLQDTSVHIVSAEKIWLDRFNRVPNPVWIASTFKGSKKDVLELWKESSAGLKSFMENFDDAQMESILAFKRLNGELYEQQHYQVFAHVFNHSSYHRGQIVTMLRQAGFTDVASTDMLGYFRK